MKTWVHQKEGEKGPVKIEHLHLQNNLTSKERVNITTLVYIGLVGWGAKERLLCWNPRVRRIYKGASLGARVGCFDVYKKGGKKKRQKSRVPKFQLFRMLCDGGQASLSPAEPLWFSSSMMGTIRLSLDIRLYFITKRVKRWHKNVSFCTWHAHKKKKVTRFYTINTIAPGILTQ